MSTTESPAPLSVPLTVMQCGSCRWWRFKSSVDDGPGWGICDNEANAEQVKVTGTNYVRSTLAKCVEVPLEQALEVIEGLDTRFREDFGCRHWQGNSF
jgi:hypothetical protein